MERIVRLNSSNSSISAEGHFESSSVHMDELDTAPLRGPPSHVRFATPRSPCCVGPHHSLPSQAAVPHDVLLMPDHSKVADFAQGIARLAGPPSVLLLASANRVDRLDLATESFALEPVSLEALPYCDNTTDPAAVYAVYAVAAWGSVWTLLACHALHVFQSDAVVPSQSYGLPREAGCRGNGFGHVALTGSVLAVWWTCMGSSNATLLMAPMSDVPVTPTVRTIATRTGACISCVSASGSLLAVGGSDGCSRGGEVTLWQLSSGENWVKRSTIVADPLIAFTFGSQGCGFGRVVLLYEDLLFVGMPDAHGGAGSVALYDLKVPEAPELRCEWRPPTGEARFGSALAIRASSASPTRLLLAVGMESMVSVQQVYPDADTGLPVCAGAILNVMGGPLASDASDDAPVTLLLSPSALVVGGTIPASAPASGSGAATRGLFVTSLCEQDHAKTSNDFPELLPFSCHPCQSTHRSLGGADHACVPCSETQCVPLNQTTLNATLDASDLQMQSGDYIVAAVYAMTEASLSITESSHGEPVSTARSVEVIVDLTPPLAAPVYDAELDVNMECRCR